MTRFVEFLTIVTASDLGSDQPSSSLVSISSELLSHCHNVDLGD